MGKLWFSVKELKRGWTNDASATQIFYLPIQGKKKKIHVESLIININFTI